MRYQRRNPAFFVRRQNWNLLICLLSTLCLSYVALGQSGRRKDPPQAPPIVVPPLPQPPRIKSILVVGHSIDDADTKEIWSTYRGAIAKACLKKLEEQPGPEWKVSDGGRIGRKEAHESAKQQTDTYVLWFGYRTVGRSHSISYVDFLLLAPQTGIIVMKGRIDPNASGVGPLSQAPVLSKSLGDQLEAGGRLVAERVRARF